MRLLFLNHIVKSFHQIIQVFSNQFRKIKFPHISHAIPEAFTTYIKELLFVLLIGLFLFNMTADINFQNDKFKMSSFQLLRDPFSSQLHEDYAKLLLSINTQAAKN